MWLRALARRRGHALTALALSAGGFTASALADGNFLCCWGRNLEGQTNVPASLGNIVAAAGGVYHTLALRPDGTVVAWGLNAEGQISVPAGLVGIKAIGAGNYHSIAVENAGTVRCWGRNVEGQCNAPVGLTNVADVSAGWKHSLARRADGSLVAWGQANTPQIAIPANLGVVSRIASGSQHNIALQSDGTVRCWGAGTTNTGASPNLGQSIVPAGLSGVVGVAAGALHSVALKADGTVVCWGQNAFGASTPPAGLTEVTAIAAGSAHTIAIRRNGAVVGWGSNSNGQLVAPPTMPFASVIFTGAQHSGAIANPAPTAVLVTTTPADCYSANGHVDVNVTETTSVAWSGPDGFSATGADLHGVAAGTYTMTATGPGGTATLTVTVATAADVIAPSIGAFNASASVEADLNCNGIVPDFTASVVATDNCSATGALVVSQSPVAGTSIGLGSHDVTISVRDESGNIKTATATLAVTGTASTYYADADGDGFGNAAQPATHCIAPTGFVSNGSDCDDANNAIRPGATETCNGIDDDCVQGVDNGLDFSDYFVDGDNDGYGAGAATSSCKAIEGSVLASGDCNDANNAIRPGAAETCNEIDEDCDTQVDEGLPTIDYYRDADGDGYGDATNIKAVCALIPPAGYLVDRTDCNDASNAVNPGAAERCADLAIDNNCNGSTGENEAVDRPSWYADVDDDGAGDGQTSILSCTQPDGFVDNTNDLCPANPLLVSPLTYFRDFDQDEFGDAGTPVQACEKTAPLGTVTNSADCNDAAILFADVDGDDHGAGDYAACGVPTNDDECPTTRERLVPAIWYADADNDGAGDAAVTQSACDQPAGFVANTLDNCPAIQALTEPVTYFIDGDGDGYGVDSATTSVCLTSAPAGYSAVATDCNPADATIHPSAPEFCNGIDEDCDQVVDEDLTFATYYRDLDGDGFGNAADTESSCAGKPSVGFVANGTDCDDNRGSVHAMATFHIDQDQDHFGVAATASLCEAVAPAGYADNANDCDDAHAGRNPGAAEVCDSLDTDENCNGSADDLDATVLASSRFDFFADTDNDGATLATAERFCDSRAGYLAAASALADCDDAIAAIHPGASEICNGIDDDCAGGVDDGLVFTTYYRDSDNDSYGDGAATESNCTGSPSNGFVRGALDCDDSSPAVRPGAVENCANLAVDNDCDGSIDESEAIDRVPFYADVDDDGAGDPGISQLACAATDGFVANANDECPLNGDLVQHRTYYPDVDGDGLGDGAVPTSSCESTAPDGYSVSAGDGCTTDPAKTQPGQCGCGHADTDSDGDGTADCNDGCPSDPAKIQPGQCGCGIADTDSDGDGKSDCVDLCPNDPAKIQPGQCGCGIADTDTNGDGVSDCGEFQWNLEPSKRSVKAGDQLVVRLSSSWPVAASAPVRAISMQIALRFDNARLRLDEVNNQIAGAPFSQELAQIVGVDNSSSPDPLRGTLVYAAGIDIFGETADIGMTQAAPLAEITFTVLGGQSECDAADLVRIVPALGSAPIRTRLTTEETNGSDGIRMPLAWPMLPVSLDFDAATLSGVPADIALPTDAGNTIGAVIAEPTVTAADGCDLSVTPTLLVTLPDGSTRTTWPAVFPRAQGGVSLATWTAIDDAGNLVSRSMRIAIGNYQLLDADLSFVGSLAFNSNRAIMISADGWSQPFTVPMTGAHGAIAGIQVPVSASYGCITAKDTGHSLTRAVAASVNGRRYSAAFELLQGDSNNDDSVDIFDFSIFATDRGLASGPAGRSNFNADALVNNADFTFLTHSFFMTGDSCGGTAAAREPVARVAVKELRRRGLGHLAAADFNNDGWIDQRDIQLYMQGMTAPNAHGGAPAAATRGGF